MLTKSQTALRKEKLREDILELFDSLSERSEQTKSKIKLYSRDPDLHAKSEQLYMAVLDCIRLSITWLDSSSACQCNRCSCIVPIKRLTAWKQQ